MKPYTSMTRDNTALLVIDVINSCVHEKCERKEWKITFGRIRLMVPRLVTFIKDFKKKIGASAIYAKTTPWQKEFLQSNINELYTDPYAFYYSSDTTGFAEEFYQVSPKQEDIVITKNTYDAFSNTNLDGILKERGIRYLVMTGIFSDGCVLSTICNGFSRGYNFVILKDLIETTDSHIRQELQESLVAFTFPVMYGKTMTSKEFLQSMGT